jgi:triacylglycerol lipase
MVGIGFEKTIAPLIATASPPRLLTVGLDVAKAEYEGMAVYELTPPNPSGKYEVAIHGGAYVVQPTILHWFAYARMARRTGATVVVPIYPLANADGTGGTAGTVEPAIADLISTEISAHSASNVSVYGDSAGGGIALAAAELLVAEGRPVPASLVLVSPTLDAALNNPNIAFVNDPVLNQAELQKDGRLWAGNLKISDPLVSPINGSLLGLPPTYVYSGSNDVLAPDVLVVQQKAIDQGAPMSFILYQGEIHDWALLPLLDGARVQSQIYQELGLIDRGD